MRRALTLLLCFAALCATLLLVLGTRVTGLPPFGVLLDPWEGVYRTARSADQPPPEQFSLPGLEGEVRLYWDDRGVPHIFAEHDLDGIAALGYAAARDRLFQIDFIPRAASGRLAAALGPAAVPADRFLRATGMDWAARRNLERLEKEDGEELAVIEAYCRGVNAYVESLDEADLPFEFRLLGYRPDPCSPIQALRVLQYMSYDLTYSSDEARYGTLRQRLGQEAFERLYPRHQEYAVPIIPPDQRGWLASSGDPDGADRTQARSADGGARSALPNVLPNALPYALPYTTHDSSLEAIASISPMVEGFLHGKGSNNWAVHGARSATGAPILAGDMHLSVTLPAIWYEAHLVTPTIRSYGVTIPGSPLPVEAMTERTAWAFTNTGSDQIDHYRLEVVPSTEAASGLAYMFEGEDRPVEAVLDTILVNGGAPVVDTLFYTHWGPAARTGGEWIAIQWTAHKESRTLSALLGMNRAATHEEFQEALRGWDTPMQNILYADVEGTISIRSTGYAPVRRGGTGSGLLDGSSDDGTWTGRIAFDDLPYAANPAQEFLTSTNQEPTDGFYPHYLGHDWGRVYRSIRIDSLLRGRSSHGVEDLKRYQADVHAVQRDFFVPLIDTLSGLSDRAARLRRLLVSWDGSTSVNERAPIGLHYFLDALEQLTWDEEAFASVRFSPAGDTLSRPIGLPRPDEVRIYDLLTKDPASAWLDVQSTPDVEAAPGLLRRALHDAAGRLERRYGEVSEVWRWGRRHGIRFNHLVEAIGPLGRGPHPYPGYDETLSPARDTLATHSASWRVVVDFSDGAPKGFGVYPGGQSGNPFSRFYDAHIETYLSFDYYDLIETMEEDALPASRIRATTLLSPASR